MATSTPDEQLREDVERALRRLVDVTVVLPWTVATWIPRCLVRRARRVATSAVNSAPAQAARTVSDLARQAASPVESTVPAAVTPVTPAVSVTGASSPATPAKTASSDLAADALAIDDYESLAASQVVTRLDGLTADELAAVHTFESANRARRTILGKIDQLSR